MDDSLKKSIDLFFKRNLYKKSKVDAVNFTLTFVQNLVVYKRDDEYVGETWKLPEQSIIEGFGDCEDSAVLFAYLVSNILKMNCLILISEHHVNVAISEKYFANMENPQFVEINSEKFYICETTLPGNRIGEGNSSITPGNIKQKMFIKAE